MENKVGERIRYHRLQRGMSQEKLALLAGINPAFLGHLERGLKSPTMTTLDKIIDALGLNYSEFFDDAVRPEDTESRKFYTDMIYGCIKRLPDEKLKAVAEIVMKITDIAE
ncbi:MAG: helix-turn-helix domain-containing protein [Prevotella sp.]|nr:helix-turn-helix domain-containing protein [Alistipes senegalensis]MCM1358610.1 helix-turn-helix domain-containing protein [Prevotella sp.]